MKRLLLSALLSSCAFGALSPMMAYRYAKLVRCIDLQTSRTMSVVPTSWNSQADVHKVFIKEDKPYDFPWDADTKPLQPAEQMNFELLGVANNKTLREFLLGPLSSGVVDVVDAWIFVGVKNGKAFCVIMTLSGLGLSSCEVVERRDGPKHKEISEVVTVVFPFSQVALGANARHRIVDANMHGMLYKIQPFEYKSLAMNRLSDKADIDSLRHAVSRVVTGFVDKELNKLSGARNRKPSISYNYDVRYMVMPSADVFRRRMRRAEPEQIINIVKLHDIKRTLFTGSRVMLFVGFIYENIPFCFYRLGTQYRICSLVLGGCAFRDEAVMVFDEVGYIIKLLLTKLYKSGKNGDTQDFLCYVYECFDEDGSNYEERSVYMSTYGHTNGLHEWMLPAVVTVGTMSSREMARRRQLLSNKRVATWDSTLPSSGSEVAKMRRMSLSEGSGVPSRGGVLRESANQPPSPTSIHSASNSSRKSLGSLCRMCTRNMHTFNNQFETKKISGASIFPVAEWVSTPLFSEDGNLTLPKSGAGSGTNSLSTRLMNSAVSNLKKANVERLDADYLERLIGRYNRPGTYKRPGTVYSFVGESRDKPFCVVAVDGVYDYCDAAGGLGYLSEALLIRDGGLIDQLTRIGGFKGLGFFCDVYSGQRKTHGVAGLPGPVVYIGQPWRDSAWHERTL